jgi:hypothetical protein
MQTKAKQETLTNDDIDQLAEQWLMLKKRERALRDERWALENRIADRVGRVVEGKSSLKGRRFRIELRFRVRRKLDLKRWKKLRDRIPEELQPVRTKVQLDGRRYFDLVDDRPDLARIVRKAIDIRPNKVSVKVVQQARRNAR